MPLRIFLLFVLLSVGGLAGAAANAIGAPAVPHASLYVGAGADGNVNALAVQSDGKILIGGEFTHYNGQPRGRLARLNNDGSLDTGFATGAGADDWVRAIAVQGDGKILVGGYFAHYDGVARGRVARLNSDGTLDTGFLATGTGADSDVYAIALQSSGKIVVGGNFTHYNATARGYIARLDVDGALDPDFLPSGPGAYPGVSALAVLGDDKILIGGDFWHYNNTLRGKLARLNSDGTLDTAFLATGAGATGGTYPAVEAIAVQSDNRIVIGGYFAQFNGVARGYAARLNDDGTLDTGFMATGAGADNRVTAVAAQSGGKVLIAGRFTHFNGVARGFLARLASDGTLDADFLATGTGAYGYVNAVGTQGDGRLLIGGDFLGYNNTARAHVARLNGDGTLDAAFPGSGGQAGGLSWEDISDRLPPQAIGVRAVSRVAVVGSKVWAAGPNTGTLYRSEDGGGTFTDIATALPGFSSLIFFDGLNGAAFSSTKIFRTTDGGSTWGTPVTIGTGIHAARFATPSIGYVAGGSGILYRTADGGATWEKKFLSVTCCTITDLAFPDPAAPDTGYMAIANSGSTVFRTTDGGTTWNVMTMPGISGGMNAFHFASPTLGWAVGDGGEIARYKDGSWTKQVSNAPFSQFFEQVALYGVSFGADGLSGWAVGNGGTILHTTDGGQAWFQEGQALNLPAQTALTGIVAVTPGLAFASGYPAALMGGPADDFRRLFTVSAPVFIPLLDVDDNGATDALTDGLLILRYLFGFTGTALTNGAIGSVAQRTDPAAIVDYLAAVRTQLDVDDDTHADALTDGLLILRYLSGLRDAALIQGVVAPGASRASAASIQAYIESLRQ